jgi:hypothetical protein
MIATVIGKGVIIHEEDLADFCQEILIDLINLGAIDAHTSTEKLDQYALWMKKGIEKREGIDDIWMPD